MRNSDNNLLVLTVYLIGVTYTLNRMVESIDDQVKIEFKKAEVEQQLKDQNLQDIVGINFTLKSLYPIEEPKELSMGIENKSEKLAIYVDWDNSAFEEFDGGSRRVIRKSPDVTRDLGVPQIPSLIVPKKTLKEAVTSESVFRLDKESGTYTPQTPLANIIKLKNGPTKAQKKQFAEFMERKLTFKFSLDLVLRVAEANVGLESGRSTPPIHIIKCPFEVRKLPWTYALPWNKKR
ncbi:hypothetical protein [Iningainema tapete]|uniref:Uncharacterized protein n=1 Tax=Iningainema tapete BLCC-T55 TaxID=2748662 RepID=A0A8J6XC62_9CYAN|nr:hypothetical protein [Iningainema tapete]MBD2772209.1 hypothetical protein [Iningainema tapete BLCC-T55]